MSRAIDDFRQTHSLCDVLSLDGVLTVHFCDARHFELSGCWPVDSSIYHDRGRWCCTVERYVGADEEGRRLFRPGTGLDLMEDDIVSVTEKSTGDVLYQKT